MKNLFLFFFLFIAESDISTFAARTVHFRSSNEPHKSLFTEISRPKALRELYEAAAIVAVRSLDSLRRDRNAGSSMDMFMCTPVLGKRRRDKSLDIESRVVRIFLHKKHVTYISLSLNCFKRATLHGGSEARINYRQSL